MRNLLTGIGTKTISVYRNLGQWRKVFVALVCAVVFCTTYLMIVPAITLQGSDEPAGNTIVLTDTATTGDRIGNLKLYYKHPGDSDWSVFSDGTEISGDENIMLTGTYYVSKKNLLNSDGKFTYQLADYMNLVNIEAEQEIVDSQNPANKVKIKMVAKDGVMNVSFEDGWENILHNETIVGDFNVSAKIDASRYEGGEGTIMLGNTEIQVAFADDIQGQYSNVTIDKSQPRLVAPTDDDYSMDDSRYEGKHYLEYTITVTAGDEGKCKNIKILDTVTNTGKGKDYHNNGSSRDFSFRDRYIEGYAGVTGSSRAVTSIADIDGDKGSVYLTMHSDNSDKDHFADEAGIAANPKSDSMVWNIGDMDAGEVKTLTYKVAVTDDYIGFAHGSSNDADGGVLNNKASAFSYTHKRGEDTSNFEPKGDLDIKKYSEQPVFNPQTNSYDIEYRIVVTAPEDNSYVMTDAKLNDVLNASGLASTGVVYNKTSLELYDGDGKDGVEGLKKIAIPDPSTLPYRNVNPEVGAQSMTVIIGDIQPGEAKTLKYTVTIPINQFLSNNSGRATLKNTGQIYDDEVKDPTRYGQKLGEETQTNTVDLKHWGGKMQGSVSSSGKTVTMDPGDDFYDMTSGKILPADPESSFFVPAQNIEYKLVINQTGGWDLSGTSINDQISQSGNDIVAYAGWAKINAYRITDEDRGHLPADITDANAFRYLEENAERVKTVWVKIDNLKSFSFKPSDIGLTDKELAYTVDYYTYIKDDAFSHLDLSNSFRLSGTVGIGGNYYSLLWGGADLHQTIHGKHDFSIDKQSWYYNSQPEAGSDFTKGELYWAVKVNATDSIQAGTKIKDIPEISGSNMDHAIIDGQSLIGIYLGPKDVNFAQKYENGMSAFEADGDMNELTSRYSVEYNGYNGMVVTFDENANIPNGKSLYMVVKTHPTVLPQERNQSSMTYANKVQSKPVEQNDYDEGITATQPIVTGYNVTKSTNGIFKITDNNATAIQGNKADLYAVNGTTQHLLVDYTANEGTAKAPGWKDTGTNFTYDNGLYVTWLVKIDQMATGTYTIVDTLPDGMELQYIRSYAANKNFNSGFNGKGTQMWNGPGAQGASANKANGWAWSYTGISSNPIGQKHFVASGCKNGSELWNGTGTRYYTDGNRAQIYLPYVKKGDEPFEFQVVAKITDPEVLLGGKKNAEFTNYASLYSGDKTTGVPLTTVNATATVNINTLSKQEQTATGNKIPFSIVANEDGIDMNPVGDTLTLVDEMALALRFDAESLKVLDKNGHAVSQGDGPDQYSVSYAQNENGKNVLKVTVPDGNKYTISYNVTVNASPGVPVQFSNKAYWEGYSKGGAEVVENNFSYEGGISVSELPQINVYKKDRHLAALTGAKFTLYEVKQTKNDDDKTVTITVDPNTGEPVLGDEIETDTDSGDGTIRFQPHGDKEIQYDTVYALKESQAPEGYVLDDTVRYVIVYKNHGDAAIPDYYTVVNPPAGMVTEYNNHILSYTAYNEKGSIHVHKKFKDSKQDELITVEGTYRFGLYEVNDGGETLIDTKEIEILSGSENPGIYFENLELNKTYRVYELDDKDRKISNGQTALIGEKSFIVNYDSGHTGGNEVTIGADGTSHSVEVTNNVFYANLPSTGGIGLYLIYIIGIILVLGAGILLIAKKRKQ